MIACNSSDTKSLDLYAEVTLSKQTCNKYKNEKKLNDKVHFLRNWYTGKDGAGAKKVDSAMRIFDSDKEIVYPEFFKKVFDFA
jgi:hypothetical protein